MKIDNITEYEPYGKEWNEEISKLPKADLIKMIRQNGLERSHKEPCSKCKWEATAIGVGSDSPCDGCRTDNFEPKVKKK